MNTTVEQTAEELKQQEAVKQWLKEQFSFPRLANEQTNELVAGMASLLHAAATMVIKSGSRQREGMKAIESMQDALMYYYMSQAISREAQETVAEEDTKS